MKNTFKTWKRLLSLTMALFLVLSYIPADVFAEEISAAEAELLTVSVTTVEVPAETEMASAETEAPDENGEGGEAITAPVEYTHTVTVMYKGNEVTDAQISGIDENSKFSSTVTVTVTYKGLVLSATSGETKSWAASASWDSLTAGSNLTAPTISSGSVNGATWNTVVTVAKNAEENEEILEVGSVLGANLIGSMLEAVQTLSYEGEVLKTLHSETTVGYAAATYSCSHANGWYAAMPENVIITAETAVTDSKCLLPVSVDGIVVDWVQAENGFACAIPAAEKEISAADNAISLKVDNVIPSVQIVSAVEMNENIRISYKYTVGPSGGNLIVAGKEMYVAEASEKTEELSVDKFEGAAVAKLTISVIGAEVTTVEDTRDVTPLPSLSYTGIVATRDNVNYIHSKKILSVNAKNVRSENPTWTVKTGGVEGEAAAFTVSEDGKSITIDVSSLPVTDGLVKGLFINITDGNAGNRDKSMLLDVGFDNKAPDVVLSEGVLYEQKAFVPEEQTYSLTLTDDIRISTESVAKFTLMRNGESVTETVNFSSLMPGEEMSATASYTVKNGEYLQQIIYSAIDAAGNVKEGSYQPNVAVDTDEPYYEFVSFSVPTPSSLVASAKYLEFNGSSEVVATLKVKLIEKNPDTTNFTDDNGWNQDADGSWIKTISVPVSAGTSAKLEASALNIMDLAGNMPVGNLGANVSGYSMTFSPLDGLFTDYILINNGDPTCDKPATRLILSLQNETGVVLGGIPVYKDTVEVGFTGADSVNAVDVGLAGCSEKHEGNPIVVTVPADVEAASVTMTANASDSLDQESFAVDTKGPRVTVQVAEGKNYEGDPNHYYSDPVTLTFTVEDLLAAKATISYVIDDGETQTLTVEKDQKDGSKSASIEVPADHKLTALSVVATDELDNTSNTFTNYTFAPIVVDGTNPDPTIEMQVTDSDGGELAQTVPGMGGTGVEYYNGLIKIVAAVEDAYGLNATLSCKINGEDYADEFAPDEGIWSCSLAVSEGDKITDISLTAVDKSGRTAEKTYENSIVVDKHFPVIGDVQLTIAEGAEKIQSFNGKDYYNGEVTYTFTVEDKYLDTVNTKVEVFYEGEAEPHKLLLAPVEGKANTYSVSEIITNDKTMTSYKVTAVDYAKHKVTEKYAGNPVVVDTKAPTATLTIDGDVETYYSRIVDGKEYVFVKLNTPVDNNTDKADEKTITATITIEDEEGNLTTTKENNLYFVGGNGTISGNGKTVVYENSITVAPDATNTLVIDLTAFDLAGNPVSALREEVTATNGTNTGIDVAEEDPGKIKANLVIDRCRPNGKDDLNPPEITIDMPKTALKSSADVPMYIDEKGTTIYVTVKDSAKDTEAALDQNAGLKHVEWKIVDRHGDYLDRDTVVEFTVEDADFVDKFQKPEMEKNFPIEVGDTEGETNYATLTVIAIDNMGNKITKSVDFAVDRQGPRITLTYGGGFATTNGYFNKAHTVDVSIEEVNFDAENILIKQGLIGAAVKSYTFDGEQKISFTYEADGHYIFDINEAKDMAGNDAASIDKKGEAAYFTDEAKTLFTIDKTAPEITPIYDPAAHSGIDDNGVLYYNRELKATVQIKEHNFTAGGVTTAGITLGYDTPKDHTASCTVGDLHSASHTFGENNNYKFQVGVTDLAGNEANYSSPTFSVDLTAPTIEMTRGNLKLDELNIIQNELELAFTINDKQQNLSGYQVTVTHLNNAFQKTTVSGAKFYTIDTLGTRTTVLVNFATIEALKENDGIYTVEITAVDYAGNTVRLTPDMTISLNRFGSTFTTNDPFTIDFLTTGSDGNAYHDAIDNKMVIQEINPNRVWQDGTKKVEGSTLTVVVNGTATQLVAGEDYSLSVEKQGTGENQWYIYTYAINPDVFKEDGKVVDGRYTVLIYGEDDAGNKNTNESNEYGAIQLDAAGERSGKIEFVLDATAPIITTIGIESGKTYNAEYQRLDIYLSDNIPAEIEVYLNDVPIPLSESAGSLENTQAWLVYNAELGAYTLNVPEQNTLFNGQNIKIIAKDAAGNEADHLIEDFNVSTNLFIRLLNNAWFIGGTSLTILALLVLFILKKKGTKVA